MHPEILCVCNNKEEYSRRSRYIISLYIFIMLNLKLNEVFELNDFTKVLRVEKGVIYLFFENNKVINSCFVEMEDKLFIETKPFN